MKLARAPDNSLEPGGPKWLSKKSLEIGKVKVRVVPSQRINTDGIGDALDNTTAAGDRDDFVRIQPHGHLGTRQYQCHALYELRGELFLAEIIVGFDKDGEESPSGVGAVDGAGAKAFCFGLPIFLEDYRWGMSGGGGGCS